jgi:D-tyrosyl-tRNA(Tyr) deacylase
MKIVVQRVKKAKVDVDNKTVGEIDKGLLLLVSFTHSDTLDNIKYMVNKVINLRIFDDQNGVMNLSVKDVGGSILSVSQFTLYADCSKGNRPSYVNSMKAEEAKEMYEIFNEELKKEIKVETGIFQAEMEVSLINDGPITIILER